MAQVVVGPVSGLWRYPVKSMQGEKTLRRVQASIRLRRFGSKIIVNKIDPRQVQALRN
jgi:hypothetical protein